MKTTHGIRRIFLTSVDLSSLVFISSLFKF